MLTTPIILFSFLILTLKPTPFALRSFTYYGNVLLTAKLHHVVVEGEGTGFDFFKVMLAASSEIFATTFLIFLASRYGRVPIGQTAYSSAGALLFLFCVTESVIFGVAAR